MHPNKEEDRQNYQDVNGGEKRSPGQTRKQAWRAWKQGQVVWEEYKQIFWTTRDQVRNANALTELNLATGVNGKK